MKKFFAEWLEHFEWNATEPDTLPWDARRDLTEEEKGLIGKSLSTFQLGENSEGGALRKFAREYGKRRGCELLPRITDLFVDEERNHSLLLAKFMGKHGIAALTRDWTDSIFRRLRKQAGFEMSVSVLITAEIISLVYYRALSEATGSRLLKAVCFKILEDEKAHVEYESALLAWARARRGPFIRRAWRAGQRVFFAGTAAVVYREHRAVLRRAGLDFKTFFRAAFREFDRCFPRVVTAVTSRAAGTPREGVSGVFEEVAPA